MKNTTLSITTLKSPNAPHLESGARPPRKAETHPVHVGEDVQAYDRMVNRHFWLLNEPFVRLCGRTGLKSGRVLDIGTGPGRIPVALAERHPHWEIWAVDLSEDMLERGRCLARSAGVSSRIHFTPGSATRLPFERDHFDLVVSNFVLHHVDEPRLMFDEAARVARPGGQVLIKDLMRQHRWKRAFLLGFSRHVLRYSEQQLAMYGESMDAAFSRREVEAALRTSALTGGSVRTFRGLDVVVRGRSNA